MDIILLPFQGAYWDWVDSFSQGVAVGLGYFGLSALLQEATSYALHIPSPNRFASLGVIYIQSCGLYH